MVRKVLPRSKVVVEFDSEAAFKAMFKLRFGQEKFLQRLWSFLIGRDRTVPFELVSGAKVIAFIREDDSSLVKAYGRFLLSASNPKEAAPALDTKPLPITGTFSGVEIE